MKCQNLRQTPVLAWDTDPNVGYYGSRSPRDREMTNMVLDHHGDVEPLDLPRRRFADSQAGTAFFWDVQPCTSETVAPL